MKTIVIVEPYWMKRGMTIENLKCRKDLNFEVDFRVNEVIGTFVTEWNVILFG